MKKLPLVVAVLAASVVAPAMAYQAGDVVVRAGATMVDPDASSGYVTGATGVKISKVDDDTQLGVAATLMVTNNIGVELLASTPFKHTLTTNGDIDLGEVKQLPPTLTLQYYPTMGEHSRLQPYFGVGVNYTHFFDETSKIDGNTNLDLDDSYGLTAQIGLDYKLTGNWSINAVASYMDISTEASYYSNSGATKHKVDVDLDPMVYMVGAAYKF